MSKKYTDTSRIRRSIQVALICLLSISCATPILKETPDPNQRGTLEVVLRGIGNRRGKLRVVLISEKNKTDFGRDSGAGFASIVVPAGLDDEIHITFPDIP